MSSELKRLTDYLRTFGVEDVAHTQRSYLAHLANLWQLMAKCGCDDELCRAGFFHSIYGTQVFQGFKLPLERRPEIRQLIGDRAEWLAYLNCAIDRPSFDAAVQRAAPPHRFVNRMTGKEVELATADFDDLCCIHLYDWLEQVARSETRGWPYRREAYRAMAERLGPVAIAAFDEVYAQEPATSVR